MNALARELELDLGAITIRCTPNEIAATLAWLFLEMQTATPRLRPDERAILHRIMANENGALTVGDLFPDFSRESEGHKTLRRLRAATHLVLVSVGGRAGWPPAHEWIARSLASGAAARLGSDVVDLLAGQLLEQSTVQASLPDAEGLVCLADWVAVEVWPEPEGYTCTTSGLRRFGLPELQTTATPPGLVDAWGRAMVGLAWRLLDLSEVDGQRIDLVIATRFPSYLVKHPNKVVWLVHQLRQAYDLHGTRYSDFAPAGRDARVVENV